MKLNDVSKILSLIEKPDVSPLAKKAYLSESEHFLKQLKLSMGKRIVIDDFQLLQPWAIAAIAALSRPNDVNILYVENNKSTPCSKFAHSIGLNEIIRGESVRGFAESGRTVKLRSVIKYEEIEPISNEISHLIISDDEKG